MEQTPALPAPLASDQPPASDLRVLVLTNMWPTATRPYLGVFTKRQIEDLRDVGVDVTVLAIDGQQRGAYIRAALRVLALNIGRRRYDIIHAHTGHCGVLACLQARYPVVLSYVGYDLDAHLGDAETLRTTVERRAFRLLSLFVARTIAKSARGARHLPRLTSVRRRNEVIPNGVDRDHFRPVPRAQARESLGWRHTDPVVLFAADPRRREKRFELCQAAWARACESFPNLRLEVAVDVSPELMPAWYSAADVLLLTSVAEGSPNVIKEALACDLPIVSVDVGDVSEVLAGVSLSYVRSADPEALAEALTEVLRSFPARSDGRAHSEWLGARPIGERVLQSYVRALQRGPGPFGLVPRRRAAQAAAP
jgi:teichuronic acid biosynthesis glycosyltransferase TuaC